MALDTRVGPRSGTATDLAGMVGLNEEIKRVIALAFRVNLMALNAIILARRAGTAARGFGVLSDELRRFTCELEQAMAELRRLTWQAVSAVTLRVKQTRITRVLQRCVSHGGRSAELAGERLASLESAASAELAGFVRLKRALDNAIGDADRIGLMGGVLARTAKIEAAYGQTFREQFAGVATDFDRAIESILQSLGLLKKQTFGRQS
jgi:methyl-accepting chemotaxis protein